MATSRFDPLRELAQLQDRINRAFTDAYGPGSGSRSGSGADEGLMTTGAWTPPVDIYQNADRELVLKAELPDVAADDIDLRVDNDTLTISGEKRFSSEIKEEQCHRIERRYGKFARSFSLPAAVDPSRITAEHRDGVLTIRMPVREEAKPRQIKVDVRG
jgi:HSP20 family protein